MSAVNPKIPFIDFSLFETEPEICAKLIKDASTSVGFFYLKNHGIPQSSIDKLFQMSKQFFDLPIEEKNLFTIQDNKGYGRMNQEALDPIHQKGGDFKENFNFGKFVNGKASQPLPQIFTQNVASFSSFSKLCYELCLKILQAFAIALQIPESKGGRYWFQDKHLYGLQSGDILRLLHYPPISKESIDSENHIRAGSHSDYGSITLLFQHQIGGLEVQIDEINWIAAPVLPNAILVNLGDILEFWTNGLLKSTKHRVVFDGDTLDQDRYTIAYFCHPCDDSLLVTIPSGLLTNTKDDFDHLDEGRVITAGEHLRRKLNATYTYS
ncbi:hypothetical protein G9A89_002310 [Geosiphon pyriformis]|nr:hypothetical protein G9A89_002310 [Geosiphon pyriformis]